MLRLESLGLSAAGILGSRLTQEQILQIERLAKEIDRREWQLALHLFLDNDDAGRNGMSAAIPRLLQAAAEEIPFGLDVIVRSNEKQSDVITPNSQHIKNDPDELLKGQTNKRAIDPLLKLWNHSAIGFLLAEAVGIQVEDLDSHWPTVVAGIRQRACRQIERQLRDEVWNRVFDRLLPFDTWLTASRQPSSSWQTDTARFISSTAIKKSNTSADAFGTSQVRNLDKQSQLLHALQLAEASTQRREVPVDNGSWTRLKVAWDVAALSLIEQIKDTDRRPEPMMAIQVPRLDGRFRLKALPSPEDLTIQQYMLNQLLCGRESRDFADAIPAVRFYRGAATGAVTTTGTDQLLPADGKTVSFAYQVDMDVIEGVTPPRKEGMFRPYYECWCDFISFIDQSIAASELATVHTARLDIRRYYDSLPRHAVHDILFPSIKKALDSLSQLNGPGPAACAPLLDADVPDEQKSDPDKRARTIVDWMCDQSFGYCYLNPSDGTVNDSQPLERGLPQGPDLSSYLANVALFKLDNIVSQAASKSGAIYARYVDDIVLVAATSPILARLRSLVEDELSRLGLELNSKSEHLPKMSIAQFREWLTDNRGGLGVSGPFAGPPINEPLATLQPLADAGEIDRTDALSLLHDQSLSSPLKKPLSRIQQLEQSWYLGSRR